MTGAGSGPAAVTAVFRPSGIVIPHVRPPYVVVVLDGIGSHEAGFSMDPYQPTPNVGPAAGPPSYCPENVDVAGHPLGNAFTPRPAGPAEFFAKWNYYDPTDVGSDGSNNPLTSSNSTPRDLKTGRPTHQFMLDAIAATGAMILPYSYWGATLQGHGRNDPRFVFNAYTDCNSSPLPAFCSSNPDADGSPDPAHNDHSNAVHSFSLTEDEDRLKTEVDSVEQVWPGEPIVIFGHSQGGLIAFETWRKGMLPRAVKHIFSLDSPINGVCGGGFYGLHATPCAGPPGYPAFDSSLLARDAGNLRQDSAQHEVFRLIGTLGDEVRVKLLFGASTPGYGTGRETLIHQILVDGRGCVTSDTGCPSPPDHVSNCPVTEDSNPKRPDHWIYQDGHFIVKFCSGNIAYVNQALGLDY